MLRILNKSHWLICFLCFLMISCDDGTHYAPVMEVSGIESIPKAGIHEVKAGESLYEIAWRYGLDYRYLAIINHIQEPYSIHSGQILYLRGREKIKIESKSSPPVAANKLVPASPFSATKWMWPAKGKVIATFSNLNKGINITGQLGEPIYAAAAGKVVYSGGGLRGYGNLIIIKHNNVYLSAYAFNRLLFVKEGDRVRQGQKIAEMGKAGTGKVLLHFEIRRAGKPIDPLTLLNS